MHSDVCSIFKYSNTRYYISCFHVYVFYLLQYIHGIMVSSTHEMLKFTSDSVAYHFRIFFKNVWNTSLLEILYKLIGQETLMAGKCIKNRVLYHFYKIRRISFYFLRLFNSLHTMRAFSRCEKALIGSKELIYRTNSPWKFSSSSSRETRHCVKSALPEKAPSPSWRAWILNWKMFVFS